eukprot:evm.model.scf_2240.4 EVM.evm.TU.scf_2240.4   scf_2240:13446-14114(-)
MAPATSGQARLPPASRPAYGPSPTGAPSHRPLPAHRSCCAPARASTGWGAPGFLVGTRQEEKKDLWAEGIADCETESCGVVPDGTIVLVPSEKRPSRREERIEELEGGVRLSGTEATFVGAVEGAGVNMLVDSEVVSARHARIEGVVEEEGKGWMTGLSGRQGGEVVHYVTDLKSTNGTFVNRGRLRPYVPVRIKPGDVVAFGSLDNSYLVVKAQARKGFLW